MDIKIHKIVPKLKGVQNWDSWIEQFDIALRQKTTTIGRFLLAMPLCRFWQLRKPRKRESVLHA
jgi:hypothetical protein